MKLKEIWTEIISSIFKYYVKNFDLWTWPRVYFSNQMDTCQTFGTLVPSSEWSYAMNLINFI